MRLRLYKFLKSVGGERKIKRKSKNVKMATKPTINFYFFLISVVFSLFLVNAANLQSFRGKVAIGSNTSTTGAFVAAYINGVMKANCTVGNPNCGFGLPDYSYWLSIDANNGDPLIFTIYNVTANDTYTLSGGATASTQLNLTISQLANSAVCAYSEACSGGYCCSGASEYHGNGIGACQASACTAPTPTDTSGGGGGGGGGVPAAAGESQTSYTGGISAGSIKEIGYSKEDTLKVTSIEIKAAEQIDNAAIKVAESSAGTAGIAIASDEGGTYKYLQITKSLIEDKQIASVKISFKVEKSWYITNDYDAATTKLRRKVGDSWQDLPTTKYKEDDTYYYYYGESPGLSYFAVTAQKKGYVPPAEKKAVCGDKVCEYDENCSSCIADCACGAGKECVENACKEEEKPVTPITPTKPAKSLLWMGIAVGLVILAIIVIALARKKK